MILFDKIHTVLNGNREVSFRHDTDNGVIIISVTGYNKKQNIKMNHSMKLENIHEFNEGNVSHIIHLLNESIK